MARCNSGTVYILPVKMRCSFFPAFGHETFELRFLRRDYERYRSFEETAPPVPAKPVQKITRR
jgi:hypothetical protein